MQSKIIVHPRIKDRHPEISENDVKQAMRGMVRYKQRKEGEWIAVGFDEKGRMLELVYLYNSDTDTFFVYHSMEPASSKTLIELGLERKKGKK